MRIDDHAHHDHEHHDHHHLHDRDIASFCFIREQPIAREALRLLLDALQQNLGPNLLRVKGIVNVAEEPDRPAVIQGAQHLLHNLSWLERWPDEDRRSKIVFITQGFDRAEVEDMIAVLDRVATRTAAARARAQSSVVARVEPTGPARSGGPDDKLHETPELKGGLNIVPGFRCRSIRLLAA